MLAPPTAARNEAAHCRGGKAAYKFAPGSAERRAPMEGYMDSRFLAVAGLAGALCVAAATAPHAQQAAPRLSADDFANILKTPGAGGGGGAAAQGEPAGFSADDFATILAPRLRTRSLVAGEGSEPGTPGSGIVPDLKIQFASNSAELTGDSRSTLDALGEAMNRDELRELRFEIGGHTDAKGSEKYNEELSRKRAASVVAYLGRTKGVDRGRLKAVGYGERQPRDAADPNSGANRRVEVRTLVQ
jgi:outer membrane protein OmpA-like peptidoglycan-associated protein